MVYFGKRFLVRDTGNVEKTKGASKIKENECYVS